MYNKEYMLALEKVLSKYGNCLFHCQNHD